MQNRHGYTGIPYTDTPKPVKPIPRYTKELGRDTFMVSPRTDHWGRKNRQSEVKKRQNHRLNNA